MSAPKGRQYRIEDMNERCSRLCMARPGTSFVVKITLHMKILII